MTENEVRSLLNALPEGSMAEVARTVGMNGPTLHRFAKGDTRTVRDAGQWAALQRWAAAQMGRPVVVSDYWRGVLDTAMRMSVVVTDALRQAHAAGAWAPPAEASSGSPPPARPRAGKRSR